MNKNNKIYAFILLCLLLYKPLFSISLGGITSKISHMFSRQSEEIIHKQFPLDKNTTLSIENIQGNINIKTEWKQNYIILKATKQISNKENPKNIEIKIYKKPSKNLILVKTEYKNSKKIGSVDYELIVPSNITVHLQTKNGSIQAKRVKGKIKAITQNGNITIAESKGPITAKTSQGNIEIEYPQSNIKAKTSYGNINIQESCKGIIAHTDSGNIKVACKKIPSISQLSLSVKKGNININLPLSTNADIQAKTKKGKLTSDFPITLKPQVVKLNKETWTKFTKEVDGYMGSGEATIKLNSNYGNIKISKTIIPKNHKKSVMRG